MKKIFLKLVLAGAVIGAVESRISAAERPQKFCPLMVEDHAESDTFVEYKGVKVFMCCSSCKRQWAENPDYFAVVSQKQAPQLKAVASKKIKPLAQKFCPVYTDRRVHPKSPSLEYEGRTIYFCKQRALDRFKSSQERYAKNLKATGK